MHKVFLLTIISALCLAIAHGCSGGFGTDGPDTDDLGPLIFTDSTRK